MKSKSKVAPIRITCRTCLESSVINSSTNITKECMLGKTFKEILQLFIPQMITSPLVDEFICPNCTRRIRSFSGFIEDCIRVEKFLTEQIKKKLESGEGPLLNAQTTGPGAQSAPVNLVYITTPLNNQNQGETTLVQPINFVLMPTLPSGDTIISIDDDTTSVNNDNALDTCDTIISLDDDDTRSANGDNVLEPEVVIVPEQKAQNNSKKSTRTPMFEEGKNVDLENTAAGNRICRSCGEVYSSNEWTTVECSKCTAIETEGSDADISDVEFENEKILSINTNISKQSDLFKDVRKHSRDTVISVGQTPQQLGEFLENLATDPIRVINCAPCDNATNKRVLLLGGSKSQCGECKKLLKNPNALRNHFKQAHSTVSLPELDSDEDSDSAPKQTKKSFKCPFCEVLFEAALLLVEHLRTSHTVQKPYKCEQCGKEFSRRESYREHVKRTKNHTTCALRKCRFCTELLSKSEYVEHMKGHKDIVCDQCGRSFYNYGNFKSHYATHQIGQPPDKRRRDKAQESHLCPVCGKLFTYAASLKTHLKIHGERTRDFICHMCPKTFLTPSSLRNHIATSHGEKKYACPICNVKVRTKMALSNHHNLKHSDSFTHVCKMCGKGFSRGDYYRRHLRSHAVSGPGPHHKKKYNYSVKIESKPVKCKYCLKLFKNVYVLRTHLLSHVTSLRYKCKYCNMTFANLGTRFRHQKRHADPNFDLSCTVCWKRMKSKEELEMHLAKHYDSRKYECTICGELCASKYLLKHHVSEQHIEQEMIEKEKQTVLSSALEEFLL